MCTGNAIQAEIFKQRYSNINAKRQKRNGKSEETDMRTALRGTQKESECKINSHRTTSQRNTPQGKHTAKENTARKHRKETPQGNTAQNISPQKPDTHNTHTNTQKKKKKKKNPPKRVIPVAPSGIDPLT